MIAFLRNLPPHHRQGLIRGLIAVLVIAATVPIYAAIVP